MPRSRNPSTWPPAIIQALEEALVNELLIPFESEEKLSAFKNLLLSIRRSYREWQHAKWAEVNALRSIDVRTIDIQRERPAYTVDPVKFPWTIVLSPAIGFLPNLNEAVSLRKPDTPPTAPTINRETMSIEDDLASIMREEASSNDANEIAEYFRKRRHNDQA